MIDSEMNVARSGPPRGTDRASGGVNVIEEQLREQLRASYKNRAVLYYLIFDQLRQEMGAERAETLLKRSHLSSWTATGPAVC